MATYLGQAVELADTEEIAAAAAGMVGSCRATGLDVSGYRGLMGCALTLGMQPAHHGEAWRTDRALVNAVVDLEDDMRHRLFRIRSYRDQLDALLETIPDTEENTHVIADIMAALEILASAEQRLGYAAGRLARVPGELGETYAAVYTLIRQGRALPYDGRWITGQTSTGGTAATS
ncbi:hypothetical protein [Microbispora sp. H10670]|uniref:hypothetical protein n=1 Tax=Microbispora sp. H10670 TaxID=2729108 RepID=UPI0016008EF6|nr:hypothetical protein [Microbispora sp. H10670]